MKTINNVQKAATRFSAIFAGLILIGFTSNAQHLRKNHPDEILFALAYNHSTVKSVTFDTYRNSSKYFEFNLEPIEEEMELEDWMVNDTYFLRTTCFETATESPMDIENWMIDETIFNKQIKLSNSVVETEPEEGLKLESWMINNKIWKI